MKNYISFILCFLFVNLHAQNIDSGFNPGVYKEGSANYVASLANKKFIVDLSANTIIEGKTISGLIRLHSNGRMDTSFNADQIIGRSINTIKDDKNGNILISGAISSAENKYIAGIVRLKENGDIDNSFKKYTDQVAQVLSFDFLPNNKIVIIERFIDTLNFSHFNVKMLNEDGTLNADFVPFQSESLVDVLVMDNNKIIVGGNFMIDGNLRGVIGLDSLGNRINNFNPILSSFSGAFPSYADAVITENQNLVVLIGDGNSINIFDSTGNLVFINPLSLVPPSSYFDLVFKLVDLGKNKVLAIGKNVFEINVENVPTTRQVGFNVFLGPSLFPAVDSDTSFVCVGNVSYALGSNAQGIVKLNFVNYLSINNGFNAVLSTPAYVFGMSEQQDGKLVIGGDFSYIGEKSFKNLIRLNRDGTVDESFNVDIPKNIIPRSIKILPNGNIVIAAVYISSGDNTKVNGLSILDKDGKLIRNLFYPYFANGQSSISYLEVSSDRIYAGEGVAYNVNGKGGQNLVIYDHSGNQLSNLNNGHFTAIYRFNGYQLEKDNKLLLYGYQIGYDGYDTTCVVKVQADGNRNTTFNPSLPTDYWAKSAIAINDGVLVAGLIQNFVNFTSKAFITKLNPDGSLDNNFIGTISHTFLNSNVDNILEIYPNRYLITGVFDTYNGLKVSNSAIIDSFGNYIKEFPIGLSNVEAIYCATANKDNEIFVGGRFLADGRNASLVKLRDLQTNVNQTAIDNVMSAFPNPVVAGSNIYIDLGKEVINKKSKVSVIEAATGKMIYSTVTNTNNAIINTQNFGTGLYLVQRSTDDIQSFIKIMVVK